MFRRALKALMPPGLVWAARKLRKSPSSSMLFDGDDSLFKSLLASTQVYGEYGCGASTRWVLANTHVDVLAVDTSQDWIDEVQKDCDVVTLKRADIHHVDLGELDNWGLPTSYAKRDHFSDYTNWLWEQEIKPDTVLIDGRFRVCSFLTTLKYASEGTKLIFDDYTNRPCYHIVEEFLEPVDVCGRQGLFVVPASSSIDYEELQVEIVNFRHLMD
ncbi:MAG: hypothetical protein ACJAYE_002068 [Candidatus Azotimanducaceae bacterium]|jgi:hypothetical protein